MSILTDFVNTIKHAVKGTEEIRGENDAPKTLHSAAEKTRAVAGQLVDYFSPGEVQHLLEGKVAKYGTM